MDNAICKRSADDAEFFTCSRRRRALISASAAARRAADTSGALAPAATPPSLDTDDEFELVASTLPPAISFEFEARRALPGLRSRIDESSEARVFIRLDEMLTAPDMEFAWSIADSVAHRQVEVWQLREKTSRQSNKRVQANESMFSLFAMTGIQE